MNWKSVVEFFGIAGILVGLWFVYSEIELSSTIARAEMSAETNRELTDIAWRLSEPQMLAVWLKSIESPEDLTMAERYRINEALYNVLLVYARECYYLSLGIFVECQSFPRGSSHYFFGSKYGRAYWAANRDRIRPTIAEVIDQVLAENTATDALFQQDQEVLNKLAEQSKE